MIFRTSSESDGAIFHITRQHRRSAASHGGSFLPQNPASDAMRTFRKSSCARYTEDLDCSRLELETPRRPNSSTEVSSRSYSLCTLAVDSGARNGDGWKIDVVTISFVVGGAILWAVAATLDGHRGMVNVAESDHQYRVLVMTAVQKYVWSRWRSKEFDTIEQIDPHTIVREAEGPGGGSEDEMVEGKKCGVAVDMRWETLGAANAGIDV
ncbi:hypothetical protein C8J57DRAFT_1256643 [Mycena rebaudengoi]|nr:hypothetical protein C8J57DRAFT_1256643 [Mycena rebaudengoi]